VKPKPEIKLDDLAPCI